jgi:hypothetical protein
MRNHMATANLSDDHTATSTAFLRIETASGEEIAIPCPSSEEAGGLLPTVGYVIDELAKRVSAPPHTFRLFVNGADAPVHGDTDDPELRDALVNVDTNSHTPLFLVYERYKTFTTHAELSRAVRDWYAYVIRDSATTAEAATKATAKARCLERYGHISNWDVSAVTNMNGLFCNEAGCYDYGDDDIDISRWDTSSVTDMSYMFAHLGQCYSANVSGWDVSKVTNMEGMFMGSLNFCCDLSRWDVSQVTNMNGMFLQAIEFDGDLSGWNTSKVTDMGNMFYDACRFTGDLGDIGGWNVSRVTDMSHMFSDAPAFDGDLDSWDVSSVTDTLNMFAGTNRFRRRPQWLQGPAQYQNYQFHNPGN